MKVASKGQSLSCALQAPVGKGGCCVAQADKSRYILPLKLVREFQISLWAGQRMAPPTKPPQTSDHAASTQAGNTTVISEIRLNGGGSKVPSSAHRRNLFRSAGSRETLWPLFSGFKAPGQEEGWHLGLAAPFFSGSLPSPTLSCQRREASDMPPSPAGP